MRDTCNSILSERRKDQVAEGLTDLPTDRINIRFSFVTYRYYINIAYAFFWTKHRHIRNLVETCFLICHEQTGLFIFNSNLNFARNAA